jgi:propanol-preferring alcohol dehydrogenase
MRAAVAHRHGAALAIEELPVPRPGPGEVLIEVHACGVCHSDVHAVDGDWDPPSTLPLTPGHEVVGRVAAVGDTDDAWMLDRFVGVPWLYSACGQCEWCTAGMETICPSAGATGYTNPGGFADYMVARSDFVARLPDGIDAAAMAPVLCAGVTTYRGLKRSGVRKGQWVAIVGVGGLGHLAVQYATAMGARVVAVDVDDPKLVHAADVGAEATINSRSVDARREIRDVCGGADVALVCATHRSAFETSVSLVRAAGTVVWVGLPSIRDDRVTTSISTVVNAELTVRGSSIGTRDDLAEAVDIAARGLVRAEVTAVGLGEANEALDALRAGGIVGRRVLRLRT